MHRRTIHFLYPFPWNVTDKRKETFFDILTTNHFEICPENAKAFLSRKLWSSIPEKEIFEMKNQNYRDVMPCVSGI